MIYIIDEPLVVISCSPSDIVHSRTAVTETPTDNASLHASLLPRCGSIVSCLFTNHSCAATSGVNQETSKSNPNDYRILFPFCFEKDYVILPRIQAPFYRYCCPRRATVVRVDVDRTTSCTDGSQCLSPRLLAIGHCSTQPLASTRGLVPGACSGPRAVLAEHAADGLISCGTSRGASGVGTWSVPHSVPHTLRRRWARCMMVA